MSMMPSQTRRSPPASNFPLRERSGQGMKLLLRLGREHRGGHGEGDANGNFSHILDFANMRLIMAQRIGQDKR